MIENSDLEFAQILIKIIKGRRIQIVTLDNKIFSQHGYFSLAKFLSAILLNELPRKYLKREMY